MLLIFKQSIVGKIVCSSLSAKVLKKSHKYIIFKKKNTKKILKPLTDSSYLYLYQQRQELCMNFLRFYAIKTFWWSNKNGLREKTISRLYRIPAGNRTRISSLGNCCSIH